MARCSSRWLPAATAPDYRVRFVAPENNADVRIHVVDNVDIADFALVDDFAAIPSSPCISAGRLRTVRIVETTARADATVSFSGDEADYKLFVHSARFGHADAAALFAAVLHYREPPYVSQGD
jgi:hypothetical protein